MIYCDQHEPLFRCFIGFMFTSLTYEYGRVLPVSRVVRLTKNIFVCIHLHISSTFKICLKFVRKPPKTFCTPWQLKIKIQLSPLRESLYLISSKYANVCFPTRGLT